MVTPGSHFAALGNDVRGVTPQNDSSIIDKGTQHEQPIVQYEELQQKEFLTGSQMRKQKNVLMEDFLQETDKADHSTNPCGTSGPFAAPNSPNPIGSRPNLVILDASVNDDNIEPINEKNMVPPSVNQNLELGLTSVTHISPTFLQDEPLERGEELNPKPPDIPTLQALNLDDKW